MLDFFSKINMTRFVLCLVFFCCLWAFIDKAQYNYRSINGKLGVTVPRFQQEIIDGTAPSPYVYRQLVPRIRQLLMTVFLPGHAAVIVDTLFFVLGALVFIRKNSISCVAFLSLYTLACLVCYPNDKPESIAAISLMAIFIFLLFADYPHMNFIFGVMMIGVRPEIPIIVGISTFLSRNSRYYFYHSLLLVFGLFYLAFSKFLFWPTNNYPNGVDPFALVYNITEITTYHGILMILGCFLLIMLLHSKLRQSKNKLVSFVLFLGVMNVVSLITMGHVNEFRIFQPFLVSMLVLIQMMHIL